MGTHRLSVRPEAAATGDTAMTAGRELTAREREALAEAARPKGCGQCGRTFSNAAAWTVHLENGPGTRCLPGDAYGQLVQVDGVRRLPGAGR